MLVPPYSSAALPSNSLPEPSKVCRPIPPLPACTTTKTPATIQTPSSPSTSPSVVGMESAMDLQRLSATVHRLAACGFYYEGLSLDGAARALHRKPVGTFLIRDSADPRYLFALSVKTERGPTSVRIHYSHGSFRLDAEVGLQDMMPSFECVLELVDYYVRLSNTDKAKAHVWLDQSGRRDLHICLKCPLYRRVLSLQHLCRLNLSRHIPDRSAVSSLRLPASLTAYLKDYPYPQ